VKSSMLILFLVLWLLFFALNKMMGSRAASDRKMTNALNAFIIAPMSILGYLIQPILIPMIENKTLLSLLLMAVIVAFAFINLKIAKWLRGFNSQIGNNQ
jgi:hypothetical protein